MKQILKRADEYDTVTRWRHILCYLHRPGRKAGVKTRLARRRRYEARLAIRKGIEQ